jgi:hypothetical protein
LGKDDDDGTCEENTAGEEITAGEDPDVDDGTCEGSSAGIYLYKL